MLNTKFVSVVAFFSLLLGISCQSPPTEQAPEGGQPTETIALEVGQPAPDFELKDQNQETVKLSSFRGEKNVVVAFYILAFTGG